LLQQVIDVAIHVNNTDLSTVRLKADVLAECSAVNVTSIGNAQVT